MTVVMGYPPKPHGTVTGTAFPRSRRRRGAGRKSCIKGVQRESLAHSPCLQGVVCYTLQKRAVKTGGGFFSRRGGFTSRKRREKPTPARSVCGVFSRRVAGRRWRSIAIAAMPATRRARPPDFTLLCRQ